MTIPRRASLWGMRPGIYSPLLRFIWALLVVSAIGGMVTGRWSIAFVSLVTVGLSALPGVLGRWYSIRLPVTFILLNTIFVFSTLFLGEVFDFYERYWWWDVALHGGSALGFGVIGILFALFLFEGDRYAAPPLALAFIAFSFAMTIGVTWEVFEFGMDQIFGLNMQKSGLMDTMWDLIVDMIGAMLGAGVGFFYLKGREVGGMTGLISEFVSLNRDFFKRRG